MRWNGMWCVWLALGLGGCGLFGGAAPASVDSVEQAVLRGELTALTGHAPFTARLAEAGRVDGVVAGSIGADHPLAKLGVVSGDVVVAVEGTPIVGTEQLAQVTGALMGRGAPASVTVMRGPKMLRLPPSRPTRPTTPTR